LSGAAAGRLLYSFLAMPLFNIFCAFFALLIAAVALYMGVMGKDIYPRSSWISSIPLPRPMGRALCFIVAGMAIYILVSVLR
jgi:hypothetical protein